MGKWILSLVAICLLLCSSAFADNYAFLVGVSDYDTKQLKPLAYARADVLAFRDVLLEAGLEPENVITLHDELQTLENQRYIADADRIRHELSLLLSVLQPDDALIVAFAGHGVQFKGEVEHYYCPLDVDLADPERKKLISLTELYASLESCPARQKLLLVDACRNDPQSIVARTTGGPELESVTQPQLADPPEGVVALFSCAAGQQAFEHPDLEHGVFFYHVLRAFHGDADDGDKRLTLDELLAFAKSGTTRYARVELGAAQTPRQRGFYEGEWVLREIGARLLAVPFNEAEVRESQRETAEQLNAEVVVTNRIGMKLVLIPPGEFMMGSEESAATVDRLAKAGGVTGLDVSHYGDEHPQHRVQLTMAFYIGQCEVTQAEFEDVMGFNPSWYSESGSYSEKVGGMNTSRFPVENVSWYDAIEFCNRLSEREGTTAYYEVTDIEQVGESIRRANVSIAGGNGYRLPTEAEWELACRAGTTTPFHFGEMNDGREANVHGDYPYGTADSGQFLDRTATVASYSPNAFGLYDMHGNVAEWCFDAYDENAYRDRSPHIIDPLVPQIDGDDSRVTRGGSWAYVPAGTRSAARSRHSAWPAIFNEGFRIARTP